jgi:hypothetical protein
MRDYSLQNITHLSRSCHPAAIKGVKMHKWVGVLPIFLIAGFLPFASLAQGKRHAAAAPSQLETKASGEVLEYCRPLLKPPS